MKITEVWEFQYLMLYIITRKQTHLSTAYPVKTNLKGLEVKWVPKTISIAFCSFISLKASTSLEQWHLDSRCSNHMIGNISYFISPNELDGG